MNAYLFDSIYPYLPSIQLARWHADLAKLDRISSQSNTFSERLLDNIVFHAQALFPQLRDPRVSIEEHQRQLQEANAEKSMSEDELNEKYNNLAEELSKELDNMNQEEHEAMIEYTPKYLDINIGIDFKKTCIEHLAPLLSALTPNKSLLEDGVLAYHSTKSGSEYYPLFTAWTELKMVYEGEPPYRLQFSDTFIDQMHEISPDFDPITAALGKSPQLSSQKYKLVTKALAAARKKIPHIVTEKTYKALSDFATANKNT